MTEPFVGETYRILNCTKASEYLALSDQNKDWYRLFISAVHLDLSEGSLAREKLWDMFDEESNTGKEIRNPANGLVPPIPIDE